jgi:hypothetical protein
MPATANPITTGPADGFLLAPIGPRGRWAALTALRDGMNDLRQAGMAPHLSFIVALTRDGRVVGGRDTTAALYILGYRFG